MARPATGDRGWSPQLGASRRGLDETARRIMAWCAGRLELYGRYVRAGREIEHLFGLSDAQLAVRRLSRETLGREVIARYGLGPDARA